MDLNEEELKQVNSLREKVHAMDQVVNNKVLRWFMVLGVFIPFVLYYFEMLSDREILLFLAFVAPGYAASDVFRGKASYAEASLILKILDNYEYKK